MLHPQSSLRYYLTTSVVLKLRRDHEQDTTPIKLELELCRLRMPASMSGLWTLDTLAHFPVIALSCMQVRGEEQVVDLIIGLMLPSPLAKLA